MLGRGHLSILRQGGHGSWSEGRENFCSTPGNTRDDMVLMDNQLEKESVLESCPKSRSVKCFSPPRRTREFTNVPQPKRLWDFSPPFSKEVLQVNTFSNRRIQDPWPRELYCGSFDGIRKINGFQKHLPPTQRSEGSTEDDGHAKESKNAPGSRVDEEIVVRHGFRVLPSEAPSTVSVQSQDCDLQESSPSQDQRMTSFAKPETELQSDTLNRCNQAEAELQEIENLKAQMTLLCDGLACYLSRWSKGESMTGMAKALESDDYLLLKRMGELKRIVGGVTAREQPFRKPSHGKKLDPDSECVVVRVNNLEGENSCPSCRANAWKIGIGTLLQVALWYIGLMMTIVRCCDGGDYLTPT